MISVSETVAADVYEVCTQAKTVYANEPDLLSTTFAQMYAGPTWTLRDADGSIGCVAGYTELWRGLASVCAVTTPALDNHPVGYTRALRGIIESQAQSYKLHRVEMYVRSNYDAGQRWAIALGFEEESILKAYGSDKTDYKMYRRLF